MAVALTTIPPQQLPQLIRRMVPEYLEAGGYRLQLNHEHNAMILDHRWVFTTYMQYSLLLLLLDRLNSADHDFVTIEEALRVTGIWTGEITRASKRNLCKHVYLLRQEIAAWFELQSLTLGGSIQGYRLIPITLPYE